MCLCSGETEVRLLSPSDLKIFSKWEGLRMIHSREIMLSDYAKYRGPFGLQHPSSDGSVSHNGIRFTAQYLVVLLLNGCFSYGEKVRLRGIVGSCLRKTKRGMILMRDPTDPFQDSIDNYIGLAFLASYLEPSWASELLRHGRWNLGFYDNSRTNDTPWWRLPPPNAWLWRFPALIGTLRAGAGMDPGFFGSLWAAMSVWLASRTKDQDSKVLSWLIIQTFGGRSKMVSRAAVSFGKAMMKQYPNGIGQVLSAYYNNPNHPDVKYLHSVYR